MQHGSELEFHLKPELKFKFKLELNSKRKRELEFRLKFKLRTPNSAITRTLNAIIKLTRIANSFKITSNNFQ